MINLNTTPAVPGLMMAPLREDDHAGKKGVYLLHFEQPYRHARHYIGYADDIQRRLQEHRAGHGARLTAVIREAGIGFVLAKVWKGRSRKTERKLKNRHEAPRLCPICRAQNQK